MKAIARRFPTLFFCTESSQIIEGFGFARRSDHITLLSPASRKEEVHAIPTSDAEPGVGPVVVIGIPGAALLGMGGAVGGAVLGKVANENAAEGIPSDEIFFYEDALRQGRSVVLVFVNDHWEEHRAHRL